MPLYGATTAWSLKRIRGRGPGEPCEGDASYQREGHETGHRFDRHDQIRRNAHGRDTAVADRGQGLHTEEVRREEMAEPADAVVLGSVQRRGTARQVSERKDGVYGEIPVHHPRYEPRPGDVEQVTVERARLGEAEAGALHVERAVAIEEPSSRGIRDDRTETEVLGRALSKGRDRANGHSEYYAFRSHADELGANS